MQVLVLSDDVPEPATHGGRLAIKNEIEAMRLAGYDVRLIAFHRGILPNRVVEANRALSSGFDAIPRPSLWRSTLRRPWLPYQVSSRLLRGGLGPLGEGLFPAVIICHHDWTVPAALHISQLVGGAPVVLRSHNDELKYYRDAARHASPAKELYLRSERARLRMYLSRVSTRGVAEVWFMSAADVGLPWSNLRHRIIPPVMFSESLPVPERYLPVPEKPTLVFVGALDIPHTLSGLQWFVQNAWPLVLKQVPHAKLLIAGRRPGPGITSQVEGAPRAELIASPESLDEIFAQARAFINPIFAGSGVNLKLGQPISRNIPIVTTTVGLRGLDGLRPEVFVADNRNDFARHCATLLTDDKEWRAAVRAINAAGDAYSAHAVGAQIDEAIAAILANR